MPGSMGGCVSRPKEPAEPEGHQAKSRAECSVTTKSIESDQVKGETTTKNIPDSSSETSTETEIKEEPLVDFSEAEAEPETHVERSEVVDLVPELIELKSNIPLDIEPLAAKAVIDSGKEKAIKGQDAKGLKTVTNEMKEDIVST